MIHFIKSDRHSSIRTMRSTVAKIFNIFRGNRSVSPVQNSGTAISGDVSRRVTGNGPFIDLPRIEPFHSHDKGHRLQLPPGSSMNSRLDSMIYLSNDFEGITKNIKTLCDKIWYQEIKSRSSNTLLYSFDLTECSNLASIEVKKGEVWNLKRSDSLAGWAGYDLQFEEKNSGFMVQGNGFFVARGTGLIYQLELEKDQEVLVRSESLLGTSGIIQRVSPIPTPNSWALSDGPSHLRRRARSVLESFKRVSIENSGFRELRLMNAWRKKIPFSWGSQLHLKSFYTSKETYHTVRGPGMVILQSSVS